MVAARSSNAAKGSTANERGFSMPCHRFLLNEFAMVHHCIKRCSASCLDSGLAPSTLKVRVHAVTALLRW
jgi:hypothetical protein